MRRSDAIIVVMGFALMAVMGLYVESASARQRRRPPVELTLESHQKWAAEQGHAEYYLDPKTGTVAWRWKSCASSYLTLTTP